MQDTICRCDVCEREKGETNGWFAVRAFKSFSFEVLTWDLGAETSDLSESEHICGQECLHKRLSQWLEANTN